MRYTEKVPNDIWRLVLAEKSSDKLYKAVYLGSGTFIISKPKRNKRKLRQLRLKSPGAGMRRS
jgi:hypothetical protein